jgi:phosphoadenylyl-sulfate reductase (thioredoxin)
MRKVRPLERKLAEFDAWITGLRRSQSGTRAEVEPVCYVDGKAKISPLAEWSAADVTAYAAEHHVPQHPLYSKGYTSIGCAPCSRATTAGEDERAGRWWWEHGVAKECGLHFATDDRVQHTIDVLLRDILQYENAL